MKDDHFRNVSKSKYLHSLDLSDEVWHLTIAKGEQIVEKNVDTKEDELVNVIHFVEAGVKPMIVNIQNGTVIFKLTGKTHVSDWVGTTIAVYRDPTIKYFGKVVGGLRIMEKRVEPKKNLTPQSPELPAILTALRSGSSSIRKIRNMYFLTFDLEAMVGNGGGK